jgi:hypothetical protein
MFLYLRYYSSALSKFAVFSCKLTSPSVRRNAVTLIELLVLILKFLDLKFSIFLIFIYTQVEINVLKIPTLILA